MAIKNKIKQRKTEKIMEKENSTDESDFSENELPDLYSLKPSEFELKRNIGDINSSSSGNGEKGIKDNVEWIGNSDWCECSKQGKPMKTYIKSLCRRGVNEIPERYFEV